MRMLKWTLFLTFLFILTACGQTEMNEDESISVDSDINNSASTENIEVDDIEYPVRQEYSDKYVEAINEFTDYMMNYNEYKQSNSVSLDSVKNRHKEMLLYLNKYELTPVTKLENEADLFVQEMLYHMEKHVNYSLKYLDSNENVYLDLKRDQYDEVLLKIDLINEVLSDYGKYK